MFNQEFEMQNINTWIACFIITITAPVTALATPNQHHKNSNFEYLYASDSSWVSLNSLDKEFSEKSILSSKDSSHDSFQEKSEYQSKGEKQRNQLEGKNTLTEEEHPIGNWDKWVMGQNHHNESDSFHDQLSFEKEFEHGELNEHDLDDEHFTQPVPELETYLMFVIGVIGIATIKRRQYARSI
jgi:hypothetical protein